MKTNSIKTSQEFDSSLWQQFKAFAKRNRRSATAQLEELMEQAIIAENLAQEKAQLQKQEEALHATKPQPPKR